MGIKINGISKEDIEDLEWMLSDFSDYGIFKSDSLNVENSKEYDADERVFEVTIDKSYLGSTDQYCFKIRFNENDIWEIDTGYDDAQWETLNTEELWKSLFFQELDL